MKVEPNTVVRFRYTMEPEDAAPFPYPKGPYRVEALIGHDRFLPAMEEALMGLKEGEEREIRLSPEEFAGASNPEHIQALSVTDIVEDGPFQVGDIRHRMDSQRRLQPFRVVKHEGETVWADFSHPFSGRSFRFHIKVERIRWATLDEIKAAKTRPSGKVH